MPGKISPAVRSRAVRMADEAAKQLEIWGKTGLPSCYKKFKDALYDWYMDLPWEIDGSKIACQHIIDNHGSTLDLVYTQFKFNMREDLRKCIQET